MPLFSREDSDKARKASKTEIIILIAVFLLVVTAILFVVGPNDDILFEPIANWLKQENANK